MAKLERRANILGVLISLNSHFLSNDVPHPFHQALTKYGVWLHNSIEVVHSETGQPLGYAHFSVYFDWDRPVTEYRIQFSGARSHYLNRVHGLKECLAERMDHTLSIVRKECSWAPDNVFVKQEAA